MVIIDGPDSWAKELVTEKIAEKFYGIDFTDESTIFDRCLAKIKEAEKVINHDAHSAAGGSLSGSLCLACMAICRPRSLKACRMPLLEQFWHCISWREAVLAACNSPTRSHADGLACSCCTCGRSLGLDA